MKSTKQQWRLWPFTDNKFTYDPDMDKVEMDVGWPEPYVLYIPKDVLRPGAYTFDDKIKPMPDRLELASESAAWVSLYQFVLAGLQRVHSQCKDKASEKPPFYVRLETVQKANLSANTMSKNITGCYSRVLQEIKHERDVLGYRLWIHPTDEMATYPLGKSLLDIANLNERQALKIEMRLKEKSRGGGIDSMAKPFQQYMKVRARGGICEMLEMICGTKHSSKPEYERSMYAGDAIFDDPGNLWCLYKFLSFEETLKYTPEEADPRQRNVDSYRIVNPQNGQKVWGYPIPSNVFRIPAMKVGPKEMYGKYLPEVQKFKFYKRDVIRRLTKSWKQTEKCKAKQSKGKEAEDLDRSLDDIIGGIISDGDRELDESGVSSVEGEFNDLSNRVGAMSMDDGNDEEPDFDPNSLVEDEITEESILMNPTMLAEYTSVYNLLAAECKAARKEIDEIDSRERYAEELKFHKERWLEEFVASYMDPNADTSHAARRIIEWMQKNDMSKVGIDLGAPDSDLSLDSNRYAKIMEYLEKYELVSTSHKVTLMNILGAYNAYKPGTGLHWHAIATGAGATGKSNSFKLVAKFCIPETTTSLTYISSKAEAVDGSDNPDERNDRIMIFNEFDIKIICVPKGDKSSSPLNIWKDQMDNMVLKAYVFYVGPDGKRRTKLICVSVVGCWFMITNDDTTEVDEAASTRVNWFYFPSTVRPGQEIYKLKQAVSDLSAGSRAVGADLEHYFHRKQVLQFLTWKLMGMGVLDPVTTPCTKILLEKLSDVMVAKGHQALEPRTAERIVMLAEQMTIDSAISHMFDMPMVIAGEENAFGKDFDIRQMLKLDPLLRDTPDIAYFTLSLMREQFDSKLQRTILRAIDTLSSRHDGRHMYKEVIEPREIRDERIRQLNAKFRNEFRKANPGKNPTDQDNEEIVQKIHAAMPRKTYDYNYVKIGVSSKRLVDEVIKGWPTHSSRPTKSQIRAVMEQLKKKTIYCRGYEMPEITVNIDATAAADEGAVPAAVQVRPVQNVKKGPRPFVALEVGDEEQNEVYIHTYLLSSLVPKGDNPATGAGNVDDDDLVMEAIRRTFCQHTVEAKYLLGYALDDVSEPNLFQVFWSQKTNNMLKIQNVLYMNPVSKALLFEDYDPDKDDTDSTRKFPYTWIDLDLDSYSTKKRLDQLGYYIEDDAYVMLWTLKYIDHCYLNSKYNKRTFYLNYPDDYKKFKDNEEAIYHDMREENLDLLRKKYKGTLATNMPPSRMSVEMEAPDTEQYYQSLGVKKQTISNSKAFIVNFVTKSRASSIHGSRQQATPQRGKRKSLMDQFDSLIKKHASEHNTQTEGQTGQTDDPTDDQPIAFVVPTVSLGVSEASPQRPKKSRGNKHRDSPSDMHMRDTYDMDAERRELVGIVDDMLQSYASSDDSDGCSASLPGIGNNIARKGRYTPQPSNKATHNTGGDDDDGDMLDIIPVVTKSKAPKTKPAPYPSYMKNIMF